MRTSTVAIVQPCCSSSLTIILSSTGTKHFQVLLDGDVDNTNNSYSGFSDIRLKENIVDPRDYYDDLRRLEVKNFNFCKAVKTEYDYDEDGEIIKDTKRVSLVDTDPKSRKKNNTINTTTFEV